MDNPDETTPNVKELKHFFSKKIRDRAAGFKDAETPVNVKKVPRNIRSAQVAVGNVQEGPETHLDQDTKSLLYKESKIYTNTAEAPKPRTTSIPLSSKEDLTDIPRINLIFDLLEDLLSSKEFEILIPEFCESFPNYSEELKKRRGDLNRNDLCIIIAGETSAGKSTLINRLVGTSLFKPQLAESTSTICRIRNSNDPIRKISYKVVNKENETVEERSIDPGSEGTFVKCLQRYVDKDNDHVSKGIDHVDVSLYVPFLKGNTMLVDTPGIGGSLELSDKMMKYLPNAVSFIFVSNVTNAGGVQNDRLVKIIQEVLRLHEEKDIPCFDPVDALFVSNKWDAIHPSERDDAWIGVQKELRKHWPVSNTTNIFRTTLKSAKESEAEFENEYKRLERRLSEILEKNLYIRQFQHEKFLRNMLKTIEVTVKGRLHVAAMSKDVCTKKMENLETQILILRERMTTTKNDLNQLISDTLTQLSQTLIEELNSDDGKERILNPPGKKEVASVHFLKMLDEIKERLYSHTIEWKRGEVVIEKLTFVLERIKECFSDIQEEIQRIQNNMTGSQEKKTQEKAVSFELDSPVIVGVLESAPKWIGVLSAAKRICAVAEFMLSPMTLMKIKKWTTEEKKLIIIDATYRDLVKQYNIEKVKSDLESTYGTHYRKLVERLFNKIIEKQITNITRTILRLKGECECFQNWKSELEHLLSSLNEIQKRIS
ncbi:uncharacterized protein LOC133198710 [Saccostrea echinata]|uniref:uncharacterized protein LOC133198710 n=1 Tax=Saccostrea echinata TaxID=191078 RepID=UPI002A81F82D|nr:uncharacterized protein LOC133198710 [Saccostrea echinata]